MLGAAWLLVPGGHGPRGHAEMFRERYLGYPQGTFQSTGESANPLKYWLHHCAPLPSDVAPRRARIPNYAFDITVNLVELVAEALHHGQLLRYFL